MMWYGGHGWGWCSVMVNIPVMVLLWGAVVAGIVLAVRVADRQPSDSAAPTGSGYSPARRRDGSARCVDETNGDFYRRLM